MSELKSELLFEVEATLDDPQLVGAGPNGTRMIYPVLNGSFSGPELKGEVLPFGADWMLLDTGGKGKIDVRITLKTDAGEFVYVYYLQKLTQFLEQIKSPHQDLICPHEGLYSIFNPYPYLVKEGGY